MHNVLCDVCRKYRHDDLPEGHQLPDGELHWTKKTTVLYPLLCSTAGLIAGLFGIGGGAPVVRDAGAALLRNHKHA